ncbi:MAG: hypothetical protein V3U75_11245 [Methylococcaceae bacterium]
MKTKYLIANIVVSMTLSGITLAEKLSTLEGIPAEVMSHQDLSKVEGKNYGGTGGFDWNGNFYRYLPINPAFAQYYNGQIGALSNAIQSHGTGMNGIDGFHQVVSSVTGIPNVSVTQTFNQMGAPYGISGNSCAGCASSLNGLLNMAGVPGLSFLN